MKIGLHLRTNFSKNIGVNNDIINNILQEFSKEKDFYFNVYLNDKINIKNDNENVDIYHIDYETVSIKNQINFRKIIKENNNDLNIFFDFARPILHKGEDIFVINDLNNLLYETQEVNTFSKKYKYHFFLEHSSLYSKKIVSFLENVKQTLNEKINIEEEKINTIHPFFYKKDFSKFNEKLNILQKNQFIIYNSGSGKENIKIFFEAIFNYNINNTEKIDIVFIGDEYNDVEIRKLALQYELIGNINYIEDDDKIKYPYYKKASFIIYPTYHDVFPFELNDALNCGTPILALDTESIKEIFGDTLNYFKANSLLDLEKNIKILLNKKSRFDYKGVFEKYSAKNFVNNLKKLFPTPPLQLEKIKEKNIEEKNNFERTPLKKDENISKIKK